MSSQSLAEQIAGELVTAAGGLAALIAPALLPDLQDRAERAAPRIAAQLTSGDDHLAAETILDLACAGVIPQHPGAAWWATPLGRAVAASAGHPSAQSVSQSAAAAMLGVTRGTVAQLLARGALERHPSGGVSTESIRARITRLRRRRGKEEQ